MRPRYFLLILLITVAGLTVKAQTAPVEGWYKMTVAQNGRCVGIENASKDNGSRLVIEDYSGKDSQKFLVKRNPDGTYSFFAGHSNKSICAQKGDNSEGDLIVQNTLSQVYGKWYLDNYKDSGCLPGFKLKFAKSSGKPIQLVNGGFSLVEQKYFDAALDCSYTFTFEPVASPKLKAETKVKPLNTRPMKERYQQ